MRVTSNKNFTTGNPISDETLLTICIARNSLNNCRLTFGTQVHITYLLCDLNLNLRCSKSNLLKERAM